MALEDRKLIQVALAVFVGPPLLSEADMLKVRNSHFVTFSILIKVR